MYRQIYNNKFVHMTAFRVTHVRKVSAHILEIHLVKGTSWMYLVALYMCTTVLLSTRLGHFWKLSICLRNIWIWIWNGKFSGQGYFLYLVAVYVYNVYNCIIILFHDLKSSFVGWIEATLISCFSPTSLRIRLTVIRIIVDLSWKERKMYIW